MNRREAETLPPPSEDDLARRLDETRTALVRLQRTRAEADHEHNALMNLLVEQRCTVGMVSFGQSIENVAKVIAHPALMIGSDSIPLFAGDGDKPGKPHPRTYGTFPHVLAEYARYFNRKRPHQGLRQKLPAGSDPPANTKGRIVKIPVLGGLHHTYRRAA